jgi:hypothetical protein
MSSPVPSEAEEDKSDTSAKQGKVRQKLQPGRNLDAEKEPGQENQPRLEPLRTQIKSPPAAINSFPVGQIGFARPMWNSLHLEIGGANRCSQHLSGRILVSEVHF